jgi:uncharacterized membrane protein (DUF2068 family)
MPSTPSASEREIARPSQEPASAQAAATRGDRLLPWIAAERTFRAVLLAALGIVLLTHMHENWAHDVTDVARSTGLNPKSNWIQKILHDVAKLNSTTAFVFGILALAYAALEGTEAYGLWHRRRWAEWLTVLATSLLLIPEVWALSKGASLLKVGGLLINIAIVAYLLARLRARRPAAVATAD